MIVETIWLQGFRNLADMKIDFSPNMNIFYGKNAQGKTNILESIYYCATGRSHRSKFDHELIRFGLDEAHIKIKLRKLYGHDTIDVHLKRNKKKGIAVNGIPVKKLGELFGTLQVVIFSPEDLQIINYGPSSRRRFMDMQICQLDKVYYYDLQQYFKLIKQRNALLKRYAYQKDKLVDQIGVWDEQILHYGKKVIGFRKAFIEKICQSAKEIQLSLTDQTESLEVVYTPSAFEQEYQKKYRLSFEKDLLYKTTHIGPHKDDIRFLVNGLDVKTFGSQGQKRSSAIALKLAEIQTVKEETGYYPVLLLDDILSELDGDRQRYLFNHINHLQSVVTAAGVEDILLEQRNGQQVFNIAEGAVYQGKGEPS